MHDSRAEKSDGCAALAYLVCLTVSQSIANIFSSGMQTCCVNVVLSVGRRCCTLRVLCVERMLTWGGARPAGRLDLYLSLSGNTKRLFD